MSERRRRTIEEIMDIDYYRSIIHLTDYFGKTKGLRQWHYRYVLIKNHDNIPKLYHHEIKTELYHRLLLDNKPILQDLIDGGWVVKDCITSNTNLSNFLNKLVDDYHILESFPEDNVLKYRVVKSKKIRLKMIRWHHHRLVKLAFSSNKHYSEEEVKAMDSLILKYIKRESSSGKYEEFLESWNKIRK